MTFRAFRERATTTQEWGQRRWDPSCILSIVFDIPKQEFSFPDRQKSPVFSQMVLLSLQGPKLPFDLNLLKSLNIVSKWLAVCLE